MIIMAKLKLKIEAAPLTAIAQALKAAIVPMALIDALHAQTVASIAEVEGIKSANEQALNATAAAKIGKLATMVSIWTKVAVPVTVDTFDAQCKVTMQTDYAESKRFKTDAAINTLISNEKVAIVALTHGTHLGVNLLPIAGESLRPYIDRVRLLMQASNDKTPAIWKNKAGSKAQAHAPVVGVDGVAVKTVSAAARKAALSTLCNADAADMMMLDALTLNMPQLRSMYAILNPIKTK